MILGTFCIVPEDWCGDENSVTLVETQFNLTAKAYKKEIVSYVF